MNGAATATGLCVALGCGLLIGIERERRKGSGPARGIAGVRSFALVALTGALAQTLSPWLVAVGALLVAGLVIAAYWREQSDDPGITTELALFLTYLLGVNALASPGLSAAAAVAVASMLLLRTALHRFARELLHEGELRDALLLAGAALIAWPLLPDAPETWLLGANPRRLLQLALLVMTVQSGAHIALRVAGARWGLAVSGLASGFVSSVATTGAMGARSRREPLLQGACVTAALMSNVATFALLLAIGAAAAPGQLRYWAPVLGAGLLAALGTALLSLRGKAPAQAVAPGEHAFNLREAVVFALLLYGAAALLSWVQAKLGTGLALAATALTGMFDVHAASASALSLGAGGVLAPEVALQAVLLAVSTNTLGKVAAALAGGAGFAARVGLAHAMILAAVWGSFALSAFLP